MFEQKGQTLVPFIGWHEPHRFAQQSNLHQIDRPQYVDAVPDPNIRSVPGRLDDVALPLERLANIIGKAEQKFALRGFPQQREDDATL